jgi:hypothetical protein
LSFQTSGSNAEAYLTRPAGAGPFPLMILLHGHTFESIRGAESVMPEAEAFASDLCYAGLAVSLPGYGATEVPPGLDPEITLNVVLDAVKRIFWFPSNRPISYGIPLRPRRNPITSFSIPIMAIACRQQTSEKRPPTFSKKPQARHAVLALSRFVTRILRGTNHGFEVMGIGSITNGS